MSAQRVPARRAECRTAEWRAAGARRGGHVFPIVLGDSPADVARRLADALDDGQRYGPGALAFVLLQQWDAKACRWVIAGAFTEFRHAPSAPANLYREVEGEDLPALGPAKPWLRADRRCTSFRRERAAGTVVAKF